MTLMLLGIVLWLVSHLLKRLAPDLRVKLGDTPGKMVITALSLAAIVLMVMGYRAAPVVQIWSPPAFLTHVNNLLMVLAVILLNVGYSKGRLRGVIRHPMLTSVKTWAIAHLLVNGDLASILLFGSMFGWALADVILINRQEPAWTRPAPGPAKNDAIYLGISAVVFGLFAWVHTWLGYPPFG